MSNITISVDLRGSFGPARNQGPRPTCLAFAASDAHAALRGGWAPLSCEYAFYQAQRRARRKPSEGALLSSMLEALRNDGQPEESAWCYLLETPADATSWAPPHGIGKLFGRNSTTTTANLMDYITQKLDQRRPVIVLTTLSRAFYQQNPQGIVDPAPGEQPEPERRHAVVAVGYGKVDSQRAVLVRNSWGPKWGDAGYGWLTEQFLSPRIYAAATLLEEVDVPADPIAA